MSDEPAPGFDVLVITGDAVRSAPNKVIKGELWQISAYNACNRGQIARLQVSFYGPLLCNLTSSKHYYPDHWVINEYVMCCICCVMSIWVHFDRFSRTELKWLWRIEIQGRSFREAFHDAPHTVFNSL